MSFTPPLTKFKRFARKSVRGPKLPMALGAAILMALVLTVISVAWYSWGGSSKLDLSRPGYERERAEVRATGTPETYDTSSPITQNAIDTFNKEYDARVKELGSYGDFRDAALDDNNIQLGASASGSSTTQ